MNILLLIIIHIYALATYVFHIWLYLTLTKRSGDIEQNPRPLNLILPKVFLFVTGTIIAFLRMILSKYPF